MRSSLLLAAGVAVAGCQAPDLVLDRTFDVCEPVALDVQTATAEQRASVDDALALWHVRTGDGGQRLEVRFEAAAPAFHGYYDDEAGIVYVNTDLAAPEREIVLAHELGHAFGLWHVERDERTSVMNPGNLSIAPTAADHDEVEALWGDCDAAEHPDVVTSRVAPR